MSDQQIQKNFSDDLDEILVKEPDGTFRVVKVAPQAAAPLPTPKGVGTPTVSVGASPAKPAPAAKVFDEDEEKELTQVAERAKMIAPADEKDSVEERARRAVAASGIVLPDPSLASRLIMVVIAYFKNVRDDVETRDILTRPKEQGGLGMNPGDAGRLIAFLKNPNQALTPRQSSTIPTPRPATSGVGTPTSAMPSVGAPPKPAVSSTPPPPPPPIPPKPAAQPLPTPRPATSGVGTPTSAMPSVGAPPKPAVPQPPVPSKPMSPPTPVTPPSFAEATEGRPSQGVTRPPRQNFAPQNLGGQATETKPIVQDVTFTPRLVGPLDELKMSLIEWRRMAPTLKDRGARIEEKLKLLEEESYAQRLKGVAAWYESDVVRLYQDIGRQSLATGKAVSALLAERQQAPITKQGVVTGQAGQPTLSMDEFQGIAEMNERLRF